MKPLARALCARQAVDSALSSRWWGIGLGQAFDATAGICTRRVYALEWMAWRPHACRLLPANAAAATRRCRHVARMLSYAGRVVVCPSAGSVVTFFLVLRLRGHALHTVHTRACALRACGLCSHRHGGCTSHTHVCTAHSNAPALQPPVSCACAVRETCHPGACVARARADYSALQRWGASVGQQQGLCGVERCTRCTTMKKHKTCLVCLDV
jgi:hypothetical protein